jgi:hypothetical protein
MSDRGPRKLARENRPEMDSYSDAWHLLDAALVDAGMDPKAQPEEAVLFIRALVAEVARLRAELPTVLAERDGAVSIATQLEREVTRLRALTIPPRYAAEMTDGLYEPWLEAGP